MSDNNNHIINQRDENNNRQGYWEIHWFSGNMAFKGNYHNGKLIGYWENYHSNGKLESKEYYL